jgi:CheY-like chemotaxis protein
VSGAGEAKPSKGLIMLVDDEPDVRASLSMILEFEGYEVVTAGHGGAALERLQDKIPHLLLTDFMMPWMNGRELILEVKRRTRKPVPCVLMSGVNPGPPEPWDQFLRKPMDVKELLETIGAFLGARPAGDQDR